MMLEKSDRDSVCMCVTSYYSSPNQILLHVFLLNYIVIYSLNKLGPHILHPVYELSSK